MHIPCVQVCRPDGSWTGLAFHGVPGGHEFTSFVLGLYNAAGPGQTLDEIIRSAIWQAVSANNGNQTAAARQLGISRTTMWRYLKQEDKPAKAAGKRAEQ